MVFLPNPKNSEKLFAPDKGGIPLAAGRRLAATLTVRPFGHKNSVTAEICSPILATAILGLGRAESPGLKIVGRCLRGSAAK